MKEFVVKFFVYGLGSTLQAALSFILLPLFLRFFSPSEYGVISVLLVVITLLSLVASAGLLNGLFRLYFDSTATERKELVGAVWLWYLMLAATGATIIFVLAPSMSELIFQTREYSREVQLVAPVFFFSTMTSLPFGILRLQKRAGLYIACSIFNFALDFGLKLFFIVQLHRGVAGYLQSSAISYFLTLCILVPVVFRYGRPPSSPLFFRQLLRLGFPFVLSGLAIWVLEVSDRLLLTRFVGEAATGVYSLAYNLSKVFQVLLSGPVFLLMDPFFFAFAAERSDKETRRLLERSLVYFFVAGGMLYLMIALGAGEALRLLTVFFGANEQYLEAARLVPILGLVPFLYFLASAPMLSALLIKRPEIFAVVCMLAAGINVALNMLVIPSFGSRGAAVDSLLAYLMLFAVLYFWLHKLYPVNYDWKGLGAGAGCLAVSFFVASRITLASPAWSLLVRLAAGLAIFVFLVLLTRCLFTKEEKQAFVKYLIKFRTRLLRTA